MRLAGFTKDVMKKMLVLSLAALLMACRESPEHSSTGSDTITFSDGDFKLVDSLEVQALDHLSDSIYHSATLTIIRGYLFLNEVKSDFALHAVKIPEDVYLGKFGKKGEGPGEIGVPWKLFYSDEGGLGIFDIEQRKVVEYDIDSLLVHNHFKNEYKLGLGVSSNGVALYDKRLYYTDQNNLQHRLYSESLNGSGIKSFGKLPQVGTRYANFSDGEVMEAVSHAKLVNNKSLFVLAYYNIPLLEIFDSEKEKWISLSGPEDLPSPQEFNRKMFFGSVSISDKYIYALYFGREDYSIENADTIYVFTHSGELVKKIELNHGIFEFDVFEDQFIYGITNHDQNFGYAVLKFEL